MAKDMSSSMKAVIALSKDCSVGPLLYHTHEFLDWYKCYLIKHALPAVLRRRAGLFPSFHAWVLKCFGNAGVPKSHYWMRGVGGFPLPAGASAGLAG